MAGHVDETDDASASSFDRQIGKTEIDGDPSRLFFLQPVTVDAGQGFDQCGLAVIDMAGGADDHRARPVTKLKCGKRINIQPGKNGDVNSSSSVRQRRSRISPPSAIRPITGRLSPRKA